MDRRSETEQYPAIQPMDQRRPAREAWLSSSSNPAACLAGRACATWNCSQWRNGSIMNHQRAYPGDEEAVRQAGKQLPYCSCVARADDDPHKKGCEFWIAVLGARKAWMDRNVIAWSCVSEAEGRGRCAQWCGQPRFCIASMTDRRAVSAGAGNAKAE